MKQFVLAFTFVTIATLLSAGCKSSGTDESKSKAAANSPMEDTRTFIPLDSAVKKSVSSPGIQQRTLEDGRLEVKAMLQNHENRRLQVQVNCVFKDVQGFPVDETPFQNVFLDENASETVRFVSLNNQATRYTVRVRQAR